MDVPNQPTLTASANAKPVPMDTLGTISYVSFGLLHVVLVFSTHRFSTKEYPPLAEPPVCAVSSSVKKVVHFFFVNCIIHPPFGWERGATFPKHFAINPPTLRVSLTLLTCVVPPACHDVRLCNRCQTKFWYEHPGPWCHLPTQARVCLLDQVLMPPGVSPGLPVPLLSALPSAPTECDIVDTSMGQLEVYISVYAASGAGAAHVPFFF